MQAPDLSGNLARHVLQPAGPAKRTTPQNARGPARSRPSGSKPGEEDSETGRLVPCAWRRAKLPEPFRRAKAPGTGAGTQLSRARKESAGLTTCNEELRASEPKARLLHSWLQLRTPCSSRSHKPSPPDQLKLLKWSAETRHAACSTSVSESVLCKAAAFSKGVGGSVRGRPCDLQLFQMCTELCQDLTSSVVLSTPCFNQYPLRFSGLL